MFGVCDGISDDSLKEGLENTTGLLVDHGGDTLDTTTAGKTADGWLGYALDVVTKNLPVALGTTLSETLSTFAACRGRMLVWMRVVEGGWMVVGQEVLTSSHCDGGCLGALEAE